MPAAGRLLGRIDSALAMLAESPGAGRARPELTATLRSFPIGNYVLSYEARADGIALVRALHGHRDIGADPT